MNDLINEPGRSLASGTRAEDGAGRDASREGASAASSPNPTGMVAARPTRGPPTDTSPPTASEVTSSECETFDATSSRYNVGFYNVTPDSTGHEHNVCQHEVEVTAQGADEAVADAIAQFEDHQEVSTWRDRADSIEWVQTAGKV